VEFGKTFRKLFLEKRLEGTKKGNGLKAISIFSPRVIATVISVKNGVTELL
jgi:hypothetical protein